MARKREFGGVKNEAESPEVCRNINRGWIMEKFLLSAKGLEQHKWHHSHVVGRRLGMMLKIS